MHPDQPAIREVIGTLKSAGLDMADAALYVGNSVNQSNHKGEALVLVEAYLVEGVRAVPLLLYTRSCLFGITACLRRAIFMCRPIPRSQNRH